MRKVLNLAWLVRAAAAVVVSMLLLSPGVAQAKWLHAETTHFNIYGDDDEASLRRYARKLEIFDALLRSMHGLPENGVAPRKLDIYLVRNQFGLHRVLPHSEGIGGFYTAGEDDIFAISVSDGKDDNTVFHEYVHHFMMQYFPGAYPTWLVEGYAEYFMTTSINGIYINVGQHNEGRAGQLTWDIWLPMTDVLGKGLADIAPDKRSTFYSEAWLLTHYMMSDPTRHQQFVAYMKLVGGGASPVDAMQQVTGMTPEALEAALRVYLRTGIKYTQYTRKGQPEPEIKVEAMPPSADDLLLENQQLKLEPDKDDQKALLATIRTAAARYPGDRLAELTLARAELTIGDKAAGEAILRKRIAANPTEVEALQLLAESLLRTGNDLGGDKQDEAYAEADQLLTRAYQADPGRYQVLYDLIRSHRRLPSYPSDADIKLYIALHRLAPQVSSITVNTAQALMRRKYYKEARILLAPVANSPHGGAAAEAAKSLLKQLAAAGV